MEIFNLSLLGKWKWRVLVDNRSVWFGFLNWLFGESGVLTRAQYSTWWKDLLTVNETASFARNWFDDSNRSKLENGRSVKFWTDMSCSQWRLRDIYPQLFNVAANQQGWDGNYWRWELRWIRELELEEPTAAIITDAA